MRNSETMIDRAWDCGVGFNDDRRSTFMQALALPLDDRTSVRTEWYGGGGEADA